MTEHEWNTCTDPARMLEFLRGKASDRKLRLFVVACAGPFHVWGYLPDDRSRRAIELAERFADGECTREDLQAAHREAHALFQRFLGGTKVPYIALAAVAAHAAGLDAWQAAAEAVRQTGFAAEAMDFLNVIRTKGKDDTEWREVKATDVVPYMQVAIARDLFGPLPFRPLPPHPESIAPLAEEIYAGAWGRMPLLGEWLQEHGFWTEGEHCLDPAITHVKGCWVVDWVTGRA
jgi:hypothetical protein